MNSRNNNGLHKKISHIPEARISNDVFFFYTGVGFVSVFVIAVRVRLNVQCKYMNVICGQAQTITTPPSC